MAQMGNMRFWAMHNNAEYTHCSILRLKVSYVQFIILKQIQINNLTNCIVVTRFTMSISNDRLGWDLIKTRFFYTRCVKKKETSFFSGNIYLIINIYFVSFKLIPLIYNTSVSVFFSILEVHQIYDFWYGLELLWRCDLYLPNHGTTPPFYGSFQLWE